jgi:hypothetical protein
MAPDKRTLKSIFMDLNISYKSIVEVEETIPDIKAKIGKNTSLQMNRQAHGGFK